MVCEWTPERHHEAYPGALNGGVIGTLLKLVASPVEVRDNRAIIKAKLIAAFGDPIGNMDLSEVEVRPGSVTFLQHRRP